MVVKGRLASAERERIHSFVHSCAAHKGEGIVVGVGPTVCAFDAPNSN